MILPLTSKLSLPELRHLVSIVNERVHPDFIFFLLIQCRQQVATGVKWSQIGTTELDLLVLFYACRRNHIITDIKATLAKNSQRPLDLDDADRLEAIMEEADTLWIDWGAQIPISRNTLWAIIDMARDGYEHIHQQMA